MEIYRCVNCMEEIGKDETRCHHCGYHVAGYTAPPAALRQDTILRGRYLVGRVLEQDESSITYTGLDLKLEHKVVVREYYPQNTVSRDDSGSGEVSWNLPETTTLDPKEKIRRFLNSAGETQEGPEVKDSFEENRTAYLITDMAEPVKQAGKPSRLPGGKRTILAAAAVAAVCAGAVLIFGREGNHETAVVLGSSNGNQFQGANYTEIAGEYLYYVDADWNLHVCPWDKEKNSYHTEKGQIVDTEAGFINIGKDKIYYIHDNGEDETGPDILMEMDYDGSNVKPIINSRYYSNLQYVCDSSGKEMLYYLKDNGDPEDILYTLWRYDLEEGKEEQVIKEDVHWYNIDGEYLYYTSFTMETWLDYTSFKRAWLDGRKPETLDKDHFLLNGYVGDGAAYLFSIDSQLLMVWDPESGTVDQCLGEYSETVFNACSVYDSGWIYYSPGGSGQIHKIRTDGTGEQVIYSGENVLQLNCTGGRIWFLTGVYQEETGTYRIDHAFTMSTDGENLTAAGEYQSGEGLIYRAEDEEIILTGYLGDQDYIVVPREFKEGTWRRAVDNQFPDDVELYTCADESQLSYDETEDGTGISLNGYLGREKWITFPEKIEGLPVVAIASDFYMDVDAEVAGILFPGSVERIEAEAFKDYYSLKKVIFQEGLKSIDKEAFSGTWVKEVTLPSTLEYYCPGAFVGVRKIGINGKSDIYEVDDQGALYRTRNMVLLLVPATNTGEFTIPDGSEAVAAFAFQDSQLTSVTVPGSVKRIYYRGFFKAEKLQKLVLSEGIEYLSQEAFYRCVSLADITIPRSVKTIEKWAFRGCVRLKSVTVSRDCEIAANAFDEGVTINYYD